MSNEEEYQKSVRLKFRYRIVFQYHYSPVVY